MIDAIIARSKTIAEQDKWYNHAQLVTSALRESIPSQIHLLVNVKKGITVPKDNRLKSDAHSRL